MAETVIIDLDFGDAVKEIDSLNTRIKQLRVEQDALKKAVDSGRTMEVFGLSVEQANKQIIQNNLAIKANVKEQQTLQRAYQSSTKEQNASVGSIERNRLELSRLKAEYIKLANPTEAQTKAIKDLNDRLKEQEQAIGVTSRNVGNYEEAITNSLKGVRLFGQDIGQISSTLRQKQADLILVKNSLLTFDKGLSTVSKGLKLFKIALASTGIGLLVVALGSLVTFLTQTQRGMDAVTIATDALGVAFNAIIDRVSRIGEGLFAIFVKGDYRKGVDLLKDSFTGLGAEIRAEVQDSIALTKALQDLEDREIALINVNAERRKSIAELRLESKELRETDLQGSKQALEQAIELEKQILESELSIAKERARISQERLDQGESTREEIRENAELQARALELEEQTQKRLLTLQSELNSIFVKNRRIEQKASKEQTEEQKKLNELTEKYKDILDESTGELKQQFEEDILDLNRKFQNGTLDREEFVKSSAERQKEFTMAQIQELEAVLMGLTASTDFTLIPEISEEAKDKVIGELNDLYGQLAEQQAEFKKNAEDDEDSEGKISNIWELMGLTPGQAEAAAAGVDLAVQTIETVSSAISANSDRRIAQLEKEKQQNIENAGADAEAREKIEKDFNKKIDAERKKSARAQKATQVTQAIITTAQAVLNAYNSGLQAGGPAGPVIGAVYAAIAGALGAVQIATISAQKFAKGGKVQRFDDGGPVAVAGGKSHAEGGTMYVGSDGNVIEVERGENMYVMKRTASEQINRLSAFNQLFGGASWTGGGKKHYQSGGVVDGGFSSRDVARSVENRISVEEIASSIPTPIVQVSEIERISRNVRQGVDVSELGG